MWNGEGKVSLESEIKAQELEGPLGLENPTGIEKKGQELECDEMKKSELG